MVKVSIATIIRRDMDVVSHPQHLDTLARFDNGRAVKEVAPGMQGKEAR